MSDPIEAAARALFDEAIAVDEMTYDAVSDGIREQMVREAGAVLAAAWPVLSAGLRELHKRYQDRYTTPYCGHCHGGFWPCPTITELDRIDRELGIETDKELGCE